MQKKFRRPSMFLLALALLALACIASPQAASNVIVITATPTVPPDAGGGGLPSDTPESPPTPTFTIAHLSTPPGSTGTTRYITDIKTQDYAPQKKAIGGDEYFNNRWERPFTAETMEYLSDVDLVRVEMKVAAPWVYLTFEFVAPRAEGIGETMYGAEFDLDKDGRGDYLVWGASPASGEWTTDGVEVWKDSNVDVGGATPQSSNAPSIGGNGYDENLVADGHGDDPDLAWIRRLEGGEKVQLALKYSALNNASQFLWNGLADAGIRNPAWFDYNDHFTQAEAGSPLPVQTTFYPLKEIWGLDNTCRDAYGFTPTGTEPGLCMYTGAISGRLWRDGSCDNLAGWSNGVMDAGEPGQSVGRIALGQGACPSSGYLYAPLDGDGNYSFADIPIGTYCVSYDYAGWIEFTTPHPVTVTLTAGEHEVVNIGIHVEMYCVE